jgi:gliding motility-associated-like protein
MMTTSSNFPTTPGAFQTTLSGGQDAVAFKLSPDLSTMLFSTFIGSGTDDAGYGIEPDVSGGAYVSGSIGTGSSLPTAGGAFPTYIGGNLDGFLVHFDQAGATVGSATYFGSSSTDQNFFIETDRNDNVLVFGQSDGGITATPGVYSGPTTGMYIARFNPSLTAHHFTTTSGDLAPTAFLVDNCGYIYIAGHGASGGPSTYEVSPTAINATGAGFYLMVLEPNAVALNYGTFYGAPGSHVDGGTSRFDPRGVVYEATCTSSGFPTTPTAYSSSSTAGWDICPFKIDFETHPMVAQAAASPTVFGCAPHTVNFINNSTALQYFWDFMDGSPVDTSYSPTHTFTSPGVYNVMLIAVDTTACITRDTIILPIFVGSSTSTAAFADTVDCATQSVAITDNHTGGTGVTWLMGDGTTLSGSGNFNHTYGTPGTYTITQIVANSICGNSDTATSTITILPAVVAGLTAGPATTGCTPLNVNFTSTSTNSTGLAWSFGDGTTSTLGTPSHTYNTGGTFVVTLIATNPGTCNLADTATVTIIPNPSLDVEALFLDAYDCETRSVTLTNQSTQAPGVVYAWSFGDGNTSNQYSLTHPYTNPGTYPVQLIVWDTLCGDRDTMAVTIEADYLPAYDLGPRQTLCDGDQITLDPGIAGFHYYWSTGDTTQTIDVDTGGTYYLVVWNGSCDQRDHVIVEQSRPLTPGYDTEICVGVPIKLDAGNAAQYSWNVGGQGRYLTVTRGGEYVVNLIDRLGCAYADTFQVVENGIGTGPFIPNAFTPNGDGINDVFEVGAYNGSYYEIFIYDRWGKHIYHSLSVNDSWDGKIDQIDAPEGVYVYKIFYENPCKTEKRELVAGSVTLYR